MQGSMWLQIIQYITSPSVNYYSSNYIAISYEGQKEQFEAKISIYNLSKAYTIRTCQFDNEKLTWQSEPSVIYGENIHCFKTFEILSNHELHVSIDFVVNETGNSLKFFSDSTMFFPMSFNKTGNFVFLPNYNDTVRQITFEYKSEEDVINKEFRMKFKNVACECGPKKRIIPCTENLTFSLMKEDDHVFCANITCEFELKISKSCPEKYIEFNVNITNARNDYFSVKSGNDWLINTFINSTNLAAHKDFKVLILPNFTTSVYFKSAYDKMQEWLNLSKLIFKTVTYDKPKYLPDEVIFHENLISYNVQIERNSVRTLKLSDELLAQKAVLELLFDSAKLKRIRCISFFENKNLTSFIIIDTSKTFMKIGTSVTVYKHYGCNRDESLFVIRARKPGVNECRFKNTTITNIRNKPISMLAGPKKICELQILNCAMSNIIKNIYTNSKTEDVVLYSDANQRKELIRFNEATSQLYKQMTFNARIYMLKIPANASILIEPTNADPIFTEPIFSYYEKYGALNADRSDLTVTYNIASYLDAKFSVNDFDISTKGYLQIGYNGIVKNITSINEYFIINGKTDKTVKIFFSDPELGYRGAFLYITVYSNEASSQHITTLFPATKQKYDFLLLESKACSCQKTLFILLTLIFVTYI